MIKVTVLRSGSLVDKPIVSSMMLDEDKDAMEHRDEETGKLIKVYTVGELYNLYQSNGSYISNKDEDENLRPKPIFFELWFKAKYLKNVNNILSIDFTRVIKDG